MAHGSPVVSICQRFGENIALIELFDKGKKHE